MWLSQQFSQIPPELQAEVVTVTISREGQLAVSGSQERREILPLLPGGLTALPAEGERGIALSFGGQTFWLGSLLPLTALPPGEVKLTSPGGGYVCLKQNGEVEINGLVITREGTLRPPAE